MASERVGASSCEPAHLSRAVPSSGGNLERLQSVREWLAAQIEHLTAADTKLSARSLPRSAVGTTLKRRRRFRGRNRQRLAHTLGGCDDDKRRGLESPRLLRLAQPLAELQ